MLEQRFRAHKRLRASPRSIFQRNRRLMAPAMEPEQRIRTQLAAPSELKQRFWKPEQRIRARWAAPTELEQRFRAHQAAPSELEQRIRAHRRRRAARAVNASVLFDSTVFSSCRENPKRAKPAKPAKAAAAAGDGRPALSKPPTHYNGGRIYFAPKRGKFGYFRCYKRKVDKVETNVAVKANGAIAAKTAWDIALTTIDNDPRPR